MYTHASKYSHPIPLSVAIYMHPYCVLAAAGAPTDVTATADVACYGYE